MSVTLSPPTNGTCVDTTRRTGGASSGSTAGATGGA
jgi:hypothetical protein